MAAAIVCDSTRRPRKADGTAPFRAIVFREKGCTMDSVDNIDRLVEIEHQAAGIISDAESKASAKMLEAKSAAESAQNERIAETRTRLEAEHGAYLKSLESQSEKEMSDYRSSLSSIAIDTGALAAAIRGFIGSGD